MPREPIRPPAWWSPNLYSFSQTIPQEGWIWEFMRRARLLRILRNIPVDAMNPRPDRRRLSPDYWNYYKSWSWYQERNAKPIFLPPAAFPSSGWPRGFRGQQYRISDPIVIRQEPVERQIISVKVNLSRRDSTILRDFNIILESMRTQHPEPPRMNPRFSNWPDMHILEVWDLRQFRVSWRDIASEFNRSLQSVRNAYKTAHTFIDEGQCLELAYRVDVE